MALKGIDGGKSGLSLKPSKAHGRTPSSEFIVPTQDQKGHSARMGTRVPPGMVREVEILVAAKKFPWETSSDAIRWMIWFGTQEANKLIEGQRLGDSMLRLSSMIRILREAEESMNFDVTLAKAEDVVKRLIDEGHRRQARTLVEALMIEAEAMNEPYWKTRYMKALKSKFGYLRAEEDLE